MPGTPQGSGVSWYAHQGLSKFHLVYTDDLVVQVVQDQHCNQQNTPHRRSQPPVEGGLHMECNLVADHLALTTTHQCGRNVITH